MSYSGWNQNGGGVVAELVGPAGAGKTTLQRALTRRGAAAICGRDVWSTPGPELLARTVRMGPDLAVRCLSSRWFRPRDLADVIRLAAVRGSLMRARPAFDRIEVLDEGPIFMLARLMVVSGLPVHRRAFRDWLDAEIENCARCLDVLVSLDAPNDVMIERIRNRSQPHPLKQSTDSVLIRFLDSYRDAYEDLFSRLATAGPVRILRLRTDCMSANEMADRFCSAVKGSVAVQ